MLSLSTPEEVVLKAVSAISSAIEKIAFLNSSNAIGSWLAVMACEALLCSVTSIVSAEARGRKTVAD